MLARRHTKAATVGTGLSGLVLVVAAALQQVGFDWGKWGLETTQLLIPVFTIPVLFYIRYLANNKIPKLILPFLGTGLATLGEGIHMWLANGQFNPIVLALCAGLADLCYTVAKEWVGDEG